MQEQKQKVNKWTDDFYNTLIEIFKRTIDNENTRELAVNLAEHAKIMDDDRRKARRSAMSSGFLVQDIKTEMNTMCNTCKYRK